MKKTRVYTWEQIKCFASKLYRKCRSIPNSRTSNTQIVSKSFRNLISLCNSISIQLLDNKILEEASELLTTAYNADKSMSNTGNHMEKFWTGRLLTYCILGYYQYKTQHLNESLKFLYEALEISIFIEQQARHSIKDFELCINFEIFIVLYKMKNKAEARKYLEVSVEILNSLIEEPKTKISRVSLENLYGLILMSTAAMNLKEEGKTEFSVSVCEDGLSEIGDEHLVKNLMIDYISHLTKSALKSINSNEEDKLLTIAFDELLFTSLFIPFISPNSPRINIQHFIERKKRVFEPINKQKRVIIRRRTRSSELKHWWNNPEFMKSIFPKELATPRIKSLAKPPSGTSFRRVATTTTPRASERRRSIDFVVKKTQIRLKSTRSSADVEVIPFIHML